MDANRFDDLTVALWGRRRTPRRALLAAAATLFRAGPGPAAAVQRAPCGCCGDPCSVNADCASDRCVGGRCSNSYGEDGNRLPGAPCLGGYDCCSGSCGPGPNPYPGACTACISGPGLPHYCPGTECCNMKKLKITRLQLNDLDNAPLRFLSAADHPYFGGKTRLRGTITLVGDKDDRLEDLTLEVVQDGRVVATATLADGVRSTLLTAFGRDKTIALTTSKLLFELPNPGSQGVAGAADGTLTLRAKARSRDDGEATKEYGPVGLLVRYTNPNRYDDRDAAVGGDDWVTPGVKTVLEHFGDLLWGDLSNMNGGRFAPHDGHRDGRQADGFFLGYLARDDAAAQTIIGHLNDPSHGSKIARVYVTYKERPCQAFCQAIKDVILADGRHAKDVVRPAADHDTHFHWNVVP